jgi:hypothetical protein
MTTEKLSLKMLANTVSATASINKLQNKLKQLSRRGGIGGFLAGGTARGYRP